MAKIYEKYGFNPDKELIEKELECIKAEVPANMNKENISKCLGLIDLTSLHTSDTEEFIVKFTEKVNGFKAAYPELPLSASICVYPNFAKTVRRTLKEKGVGITTVAGCFPSSQSFIDVKALEVRHAVEDGATEIDIVLPHSTFVAGDYEATAKEIAALREVAGKQLLKVILESGLLGSAESIADASFLSLENGADFIKTSTGKEKPAATPEAAVVMCKCLKAYYEKTGLKKGFKPAGGISTTEDAILYLSIVRHILGEEWLTPELFRIGASSLANNLLSSLAGSTVKYF